ncbi:hypothetical protein PCAR4_1300005 [Paraburkholderia caribensis]|nr:hypothetical protein PCAR4_1300005 [Paraburkholderia caribensis]
MSCQLTRTLPKREQTPDIADTVCNIDASVLRRTVTIPQVSLKYRNPINNTIVCYFECKSILLAL